MGIHELLPLPVKTKKILLENVLNDVKRKYKIDKSKKEMQIT